MRIGILHLSDMHIGVNEVLDKVNQLATTIKNKELSNLIIVVSGDVANSGDEAQYKIAKTFFKNIINQITNFIDSTNIYIQVVPGNHDIKFDEERPSNELYQLVSNISKEYRNTRTNPEIVLELEKLKEYNKLIKVLGLQNQNLLIDKEFINIDGYKVRIHRLNSAVFSSYYDEGNDNDKNLHFLQYKDLQQINNKDCDLSILIMHHSPEWFTEKCKNDIYDAIKMSVDLAFYGHEHVFNNQKVESDDNLGYYVSMSKAFMEKSGNSAFNFIEFDTEINMLVNQSYQFESTLNEYHCINTDKVNIRVKSKNGFKFQLNTEFEKKFYIDKATSTFTKKIDDIFVFPTLRVTSEETKSYRIKSYLEIKKIIDINDIVCIKGSKNSGKTSLLKNIFKNLESKYIVVHLDVDNLKRDTNLRKIIDNAVRNQYLDKDVVNEHYKNKNRESKICVIDNFHLFGENKEILESLLGEFYKIIITSSNDYNFDYVSESLRKNSDSNFSLSNIEVLPFVGKKREELIFNVYRLLSKDLLSDEGEKIFNGAVRYVKRQMKVLNHKPYFTVLYAKDYILKGGSSESKDGIFSKVFEADLSYKLKDYCKGEITFTKFNVFTSELAFKAYKEELYPLTLEFLISEIKNLNIDYDNQIDPLVYIDIAKKAHIISDYNLNNEYVFVTDNYFAYYISLHLLSIISTDEGEKEFRNILDNILVRINSIVLLFFSFLIGYRTEVLDHIVNQIEAIAIDEQQVMLTDRNIKIESTRLYDKIQLPSHNDVSEIQKAQVEREEKMISESQVIDVKGLFSLEVDIDKEALSKGVKLIKFLEIISMAFPDFLDAMKAHEQERFVNVMFRVPNIISYIAYNDIKSNLDKFKEEIYKALTEESPNKKEKDLYDELESKLNAFFSRFTIAMYDFVSQNAVDSKTIKKFEKYKPNGDLIFDLEMLTFYAEVLNYRDFCELAMKQYDSLSDEIEREMLRAVVAKFIILNSDKRDYHLELKLKQKIYGLKDDVPKLIER